MSNATLTCEATLTGRQRVQRMFARQDHDRVPRHDTFWGETIERWQGEGLNGDARHVLEMLGSDFHQIAWCWPAPLAGRDQVIEVDAQTRIVRDGHGKLVRYWRDRSGTPEHLGFDCDSREKWQRIYKPALLDSGLQINPPAARRAERLGREKGKWCYMACVEPFEQTRAMMGDELTAIAMAEDPEWVADVAEAFTSEVMRNLDAVIAEGAWPDGLWCYGDMAYNHATFCSPKMYRELIWPQHRRLVQWAHAHDMKFIYHTDGNINAVIDLYLEAGFDCLQPLEAKADVDVRKLAPRYGDRLALFGNIDVMVMGSNDLEALEAEIAGKFQAGMATRGYAYHSDHSVPPTVSWATYQRLIELVDAYGRYD